MIIRTSRKYATPYSDHYLENGLFYVSDALGLGIDFDETEAKRYSFDRRYLPIVLPRTRNNVELLMLTFATATLWAEYE